MRKLCAVILFVVVWLVTTGTPVSTTEHQSTLSIGYLQAHTDMLGSDNLSGVNVKYRYEFMDTSGSATPFGYANVKDEQKTHYNDTHWHEDSARSHWFSVMAEPSVRMNEQFSACVMTGVVYSRVSIFSGDRLRVADDRGEMRDVLTGSDDDRHSNASLVWGTDVQFNLTESVVVDIAYEDSSSGGWRTDTFIADIECRF